MDSGRGSPKTAEGETMDGKGKEKGILKLDPRPRVIIVPESRHELTPQGSSERPPSSPHPSVDRLSVTWADPGSMSHSGVNLFHLPTDSPIANEVKFSPGPGEGSEDEDYSASLSAVLRQRRASVRRSRKGRTRRPSSPFLDETRPRRRSSVITTSSGDTAISMEECQTGSQGGGVVGSCGGGNTQEQIFENIHLHKEVLGSVKQQPLGMRRKLKLVHQAKAYIKRHEGQLQERLAQSKSTRDIYARFNILLATKWQQMKREAANTSNLLIPWELRIKEIESHFGSVVASYFTFLRWLFWVNLVIAVILLLFVIIPECLTANPLQDGERKIIMEEERRNASNLLTLWEFEGILKYSPIFYGYYSNIEQPQYRMPLAYFLTGLVVYIYSFVAILRKMAVNSRMSKLSEKEDECVFSWKLFTGWDYMIGNTETAHNRIASIILGFKEALLEEAEKKKDVRNWRIISLRVLVNICVFILLGVSMYAVMTVVSLSDDNPKVRSWWRENETTIVVTLISISFPIVFELLGYLERYHPRKQLRRQLGRIMLLNLLNLYSLIFALFSKIQGMSKDLDSLKPNLTMNATLPDGTFNISQALASNLSMTCYEVRISCTPCHIALNIPPDVKIVSDIRPIVTTTMQIPTSVKHPITSNIIVNNINTKYQLFKLRPQNLIDKVEKYETTSTTENSILQARKELDRLKKMAQVTMGPDENNESEEDDYFLELSSTKISFTTNSESETNTFSNTHNEYNNTNEDITEPSETPTVTDQETTFSDANFTNLTVDYSDDVTTEYNTATITDNDSKTNLDDIVISKITEIDVPFTAYKYSTIEDKETATPSTLDETSITSNGIYSESTTTDELTTSFSDVSVTDLSTTQYISGVTICPNISFNCTTNCDGRNITQVFYMSNCSVVEKRCYTMFCKVVQLPTNTTVIDIVYEDERNRKMYNLTKETKRKLLKLCWETMFGQELVKLTMMDLVFVVLGTLFMDFFRALFVKYTNRCWCWDLEKKFPQYGDFKIAENILHLINNQGMVWMGMFFSPGLVVLNVFKLMIMMYLRSWAVMTCNVPHEVVFRGSKSNNFYLSLLLAMLFLCVLPVGYSIVWVKPSWHCGPFSEYDKIYYILTSNIYKILPSYLNFGLKYIASPAIVIPLLVLLILIIYYLISLTYSLREANNDLKIQLRRERTEERRKMFQLADTRRKGGSSALDNTPFARWKRALPTLSKSIDSDDKKPGDESCIEPLKVNKRKTGILAKIVGLALDRKSDVEAVAEIDNNSSWNNGDDETDTDFHEALPKEVLKIKDITIIKPLGFKKKTNVEFKTETRVNNKNNKDSNNLKVNLNTIDDRKEKAANIEKQEKDNIKAQLADNEVEVKIEDTNENKKLSQKQTSDSSTQSKKSDSAGSVIPVIMISTTESDDEVLQNKKGKKIKEHVKEDGDSKNNHKEGSKSKKTKVSTDSKSLRRQSSVDSAKDYMREHRGSKEKKDDGHKYQYSL